ncbi:hypothetical protein EDD18DRAFT_1360866 [Armillaria luteobubalina]|uniref:Uncharacterized protein n=1 Tax=Armillaria luteobubalina TaxID=153913 RepID=A0AA39PJR4_9AGAR|nr:hypothetical protein EDD18DRAFT_1360866 [Armillaria luteobubalina]
MPAVSSDPNSSFSRQVCDCVDHKETLDPLDAYDPNNLNDPLSSAPTLPHPMPPHSLKLGTFDTLPLPTTLNPLNPQNHQKKQSNVNCKKEAIPIADDEGCVIAVLVGQPEDPDWESKQRKHRHGRYSALSVGISFGGGQWCVVPPSLKPSLKRMCPQFPQNLHHEGTTAQVLATLINHIAFICLAGFASGIFTAWSPSLFQCYAMHLRALLLSNDNLILNFANSIFSASTFNFGPKTVTIEHTDSGNLLFG